MGRGAITRGNPVGKTSRSLLLRALTCLEDVRGRKKRVADQQCMAERQGRLRIVAAAGRAPCARASEVKVEVGQQVRSVEPGPLSSLESG